MKSMVRHRERSSRYLVRSLLLAESPEGIAIRRDYDTSLPDLVGDREKLIQAVLNIARNAVQTMQGQGDIAEASQSQS